MKVQIGWFTLKEDKVFRNEFECAAWHEDVLVKAGRYPMEVYDPRLQKDGSIETIGTAYIGMEGTVVSAEFGALFCGMPISCYDDSKDVGKSGSHREMPYLHDIARSIVKDQSSPYELFPEYEAREEQFEYDGRPITTWMIYKKEEQ